ncbi:phage tail protein [Clostridium perfringens]|nr:phage tail protein [Clostridium perfringens]
MAEQVLKTRRKALKDIYIAIVTKNDATGYTADTPTKLGRAISAKVTVKKSTETTRSDDSIEEIIENSEGTEIEFDVNKLSMEQKAILRGATYKNGMLVYNKDDQAKEVAIGWRARNTNGKYEFVWYYAGKFNGGWSEDYETEQDKIKTQTAKMKGTFYSREKDGNSCVEVDESYLLEEHTSAKSAIQNWFGQVQEPIEK